MASSRLERIGTIYTRITGLLRAGALKFQDKPVWYEVYEAFPPKNEPPSAATGPLPNILYPEDAALAKFHKLKDYNETVNMLDNRTTTKSQKFISMYKTLEADALPESLFDATLEKFQALQSSEDTEVFKSRSQERADSSLASTFQNAQKQGSQSGSKDMKINVENIFKDS